MKKVQKIAAGAWLLAGVLGGVAALAANPNQVAGVAATRGPIHAAVNPARIQVRFCLAPEVSGSAQNPAKVQVHIGVFDEAKPNASTAADPKLWSLYE